jgi:hypothetical protein
MVGNDVGIACVMNSSLLVRLGSMSVDASSSSINDDDGIVEFEDDGGEEADERLISSKLVLLMSLVSSRCRLVFMGRNSCNSVSSDIRDVGDDSGLVAASVAVAAEAAARFRLRSRRI